MTNPSKPIVQLKDNKIIAIYNSAYDAAKITNLSYNHIQKACHNKRGGAGGYKWRYATLEEIEQYNKVYYIKGGKNHEF